MIEPFSLPTGGWWRCTRYEIRDSRICPAPGSELEQYDPWEAHKGNEPAGAPYESLLNLAAEIKLRPMIGEISAGLMTGVGFPFGLEQDGEARVLEWCNEHGLLGLLLQEAVMISLAPRWETLTRFPDGERTDDVVPILRTYVREGANWNEQTQTRFGYGDDWESAERSPGEVVKQRLIPSGWDTAAVIHRGLSLGRGRGMVARGWRRESLGAVLAPFFPRVPSSEVDIYRYPKPATKEFWAAYCEPVSDFALAVLGFGSAAEDLGRSNMDEAQGPTIIDGVETLCSFLEPTSPSISLSKDGILQQQWLSPSLLGAFAVMLLQDVAEGRRFLHCDVCRKLFVATAYQSRYCSSTCRHTAQKRRYRKKKKAAGKGPRLSGFSIR